MNVTNSSLIYKTQTTKICEVIAAIGGGVFYLAIFFWMLLSIKWNRFCPKSETCKVLFLAGSAVMLLHIFTNDEYEDIDDLKVKLGFEISVNITIGIITLLIAGCIFKKRPSLNCRRNCVSPCEIPQHSDGNVCRIKQLLSTWFVFFGTLIIVIMEIIFLRQMDQNSHHIKNLILAAKSVYLVEKVLQATIYLLLVARGCVTQDKVNQAQFYFIVMSFYNGVIWLDSMVNTNNELILADVKDTGPPWVNIVGTLYKACIIDYRMLFCLVFMEHALALTNQEGVEEQNNRTIRREGGFWDNLKQCLGLGFAFGIGSFLCQLSCLGDYIKSLSWGTWIHLLTILAEVIIVICCLVLLMKISRCEGSQGGSDIEKPHGLKIVLCCFGAVGFAYWFYAAVLVISWAINDQNEYFNWLSAKLCSRCVTAFFLILIFKRTNIDDMTTDTFVVEHCNLILVAFLAPGILSEFVGAACDQYVGPIVQRYEKEVTKTSFKILFEVGPALYLAFCIHLSLHFFSIQRKMTKKIETSLETQQIL